MIPKIDYKIHDVLTRVFLSPLKGKKEFEKEAKKFIREFKKIEKDVLMLIEKFSGFKWSKKKIPLYIIPQGRFFSMAKGNLEEGLPGVVQKVYDTLERGTHILTHELSHINQFQSDFYSKKNNFIFNKDGSKDFVKIEICTDIVCIHVIRELFEKNSKYEKDYWEFLKIMTSTPKKKTQIPKYLKKWNLNKKPLKEYIF